MTDLRQSAHGGVSGWARACRQPQAGAAAHAHDGTGGDGAEAEHERQATAAQGVSIFAAWGGRGEAKSGMEYGNSLYANNKNECVAVRGRRNDIPNFNVVACNDNAID